MENKKPKLIIIRGLPGSGKTTIAKTQFPDYILVETDMFFMHKGEYKYNPKKIKEAHAWCYETVRAFLNSGYNVVVANTFTQRWEFQKYIDLGFSYKIIVAKGNYNSVHNVPKHVIERMKNRWEN